MLQWLRQVFRPVPQPDYRALRRRASIEYYNKIALPHLRIPLDKE